MTSIQPPQENYAFIEGGLFRKVQLKFGMENHQALLAIGGICFAWLPLLVLTAVDGTLYYGPVKPFLVDFAVHARFLIAAPLLILARNPISAKSGAVTKYLTDSLLTEEERKKMLSTSLPFYRKLACSSLTELILIVLILISVLGLIKTGTYGGLHGDVSTWMFEGRPEDNIMTSAGKWAVFISLPFFQFLLLQWFWRYIVWVIFLFRFSKAPMELLPTHADRSAGLGVIILAQRSFSVVFMAGSFVISGQLITNFIHTPDSGKIILTVVIGYVILCIILLFLPMIFFIGRLVKTKQKGLLRLSLLATELSRKFEKGWLNEVPIEERIETQQVDPSMAYDYASMYDNLQQLHIVPVSKNDVIGMVLTLILPFVPIVFVYYSATEVLQKIVSLLF